MIALAGSGGMVIAGRVIQGAAGATILASGLSLLSVANEGEAQLRAVSLWGAAAAVGAAAGPLLFDRLGGIPGPVCLLCAEKKVTECHRRHIATYLEKMKGWTFTHIE